MKAEKVSIVTVCYNSETTIERTILSVLNQTYENIEYIIKDGASADQTLKIVSSYQNLFREKGYEFRIISEPDQGIYDAMNKGIALTTGTLVGIINSDDWYEPSAVERMMKIYENMNFDLFYADLRIWKQSKIMIKRARYRTYATTRDWNHPTTFIRRSIYETHQYACRTVYDDWDLILQLRQDGYKTAVLNEVLANFTFGGASNQKSLKAAFERMKIRYHIYRKHGYGVWYGAECFIMELVKYLWS